MNFNFIKYEVKSKILYFILYSMLILSQVKVISSAYSCKWSSATKTMFSSSNLIAKGLGTLEPLRLARPGSSDQSGGLVYKTSVDFTSNVHVYLRAEINPGTDSSSWAFDGIGINFAKTDYVYSGAGGGCIGYCGIQKALVTEFDFYHNGDSGDRDDHHVSLHSCFGSSSCSASESGAIQRSLPSQYYYNRYKTNIYHIHVTYQYSNNYFAVYLGSPSGTPIVDTKIDLASYFGGKGYLGFSTFIRGRYRSIYVNESFLCQGGSTYASGTPYLYYGNTIYKTYTELIAGSTFYAYIHYNDKRSINLLGCSVSTTCGKFGSLTYVDNYRKWTINSCTKASTTHYYTYSDKHVSQKKFGFGIKPSSFCSLVFYGHDGVKSNDIVYDSTAKIYYFAWGSVRKDFEISDFQDGYFNALFEVRDCYGNVISDLGSTDSQTLINTMGLRVSMPGGTPSMIVSKYKDSIYQVKVQIPRSGIFTISSTKLSPSATMGLRVYSGTPSSKSYCTTGQSTPTLADGKTITSKCYLIDSWGAAINPVTIKELFKVDLKCTLFKTSPKSSSININVGYSSSTFFECPYTTQENGSFNFKGYWIRNGNQNEIFASLSNFIVIPKPYSVANANIYSFVTSRWYQSSKVPALSYQKLTSIGEILAIDLLDRDETSFSIIGYNNFLITELSGKVSTVHTPVINEANLVFDYITINGKQYIKAYVSNPDITFKLSSFKYTVTINYRGTSKTVEFLTPLTKAGSYTVCQHDLSSSNTQLVPAKSLTITDTIANTQIKIGQIILRTTDKNLYNYFINDSDISFDVSPLATGTSLYFSKSSSVNGVYDLYMRASTANTYTVNVKVKGTVISNGRFTNKVNPVESLTTFDATNTNQYSSVSGNVYTLKDTYTTDQIPNIYFIGKDQFNNVLSYNPSTSNSNLGITYKVHIDNSDVTSSVSAANTLKILYDSSKKNYYLNDNIKSIGEYKITLYSSSNQEIIFKYTKKPGLVSNKQSIVTVTNNYQIKLESISTVLVELRDSYGNNIGLDTSTYNTEINKISVSATNAAGNTVTYTYKEKEGLSGKFVSSSISNPGLYSVKGLISGTSVIASCSSCSFDVVYSLFDMSASAVKAITSSVKIMNENTALRVMAQKEKVLFQFDFLNKKGELVDYVNPQIDVTATIQKEGSSEVINLNKEWISFNKLLWKFPSDTKDFTGDYLLKILYNGEAKKTFKVTFIQGEKDYDDSSSSTVDYSKTFISVDNLYLTAGKEDNFVIEMRTANNLRYAKQLTEAYLQITNSKGYSSTDLQLKVQKGSQLGQLVINVVSTKVSTFEDPNILSFTYNGQAITRKVNVIVSPGELSVFQIKDSSFKDKTNKILIDGTTENIPMISLIPYDSYGNVNNNVFDTNLYLANEFAQYFSILHNGNYPVTLESSTNPSENILNLQFITSNTGILTLKSKYFENTDAYTMNIKSGSVSKESTGFVSGDSTISSGESTTFSIYPRDSKGNLIENLTDDITSKFVIKIIQPSTGEVSQTYPGTIDSTKTYISYNIPLTETGNNIIKAYYNNEEIVLTNNLVKVVNSEVDFSKTKLIYNSVSYPADSTLNVAKSSLPSISVQLYDTNNNIITSPNLVSTNILFNKDSSTQYICESNLSGTKTLYVCKDKVEDWLNLSNGEYELQLLYKVNNLKYTINLTGQKDVGTSTKPIDWEKTKVDTSELTMLAGETKIFNVEILTSDNKRTNTFYANPNEKFTFFFTKNDNVYTTDVRYGASYGQYIVSISSTKAYTQEDYNMMSMRIDGNDISSKIQLIVNPNTPKTGYFVESADKKIEDGAFPSAYADKTYSLRAFLFDEYGNKASPSLRDFSYKITPPIDKLQKEITSETKVNYDNSISLLIKPIYAGTYRINSLFWEDTSYSFISKPGAVSNKNTYIETIKESVAGNDVKVYVYPYDDYNNYIDPQIYLKDINSLFTLYYKYPNQDISEGYSDYTSIPYSAIEEVDGKKVAVFKVQMTNKGDNVIKGIFNENGDDIKCENCIVNIKAGELSINDSEIMKYDKDKDEFVAVTGKEIDYNYVSDPIIRFYPKDQYGNAIDNIGTDSYTASITKDGASVVDLIKNAEHQDNSYVEFVKKDNNYNSLSGGEYILTITDSKGNKKSTSITLAGNPDSEYYKNQELDLSKTYLIDSNFKIPSRRFWIFHH